MILTDTASRVILELRGVVDGGELASGDGVSDLDVDHFAVKELVEERR